MSSATSSIMLPEYVVRAAEVQARMKGLSVEEWVSRALVERLDTVEGAREFFRRRSTGVKPGDFDRVLEAIPHGPVDPGDEL